MVLKIMEFLERSVIKSNIKDGPILLSCLKVKNYNSDTCH
jgi:hypothetical protein